MSGDLFAPGMVASELQFAEFYRHRLRPVFGSRIKASELRAAYLAWAEEKKGLSLSYKDLAFFMGRRNHRKIYSNGSRYLDVEFALGDVAQPYSAISDATRLVLDALAGQADRAQQSKAHLMRLVQQADDLATQVERLRQAITEGLIVG